MAYAPARPRYAFFGTNQLHSTFWREIEKNPVILFRCILMLPFDRLFQQSFLSSYFNLFVFLAALGICGFHSTGAARLRTRQTEDSSMNLSELFARSPVSSRASAFLCLAAALATTATCAAQTSSPAWNWLGGSNVIGAQGVYGTQNVPDPANIPGARSFPAYWTDASGNFWLFGGDSEGNNRNDLWKFDPVAMEWTWMGGSQSTNAPGVYGVQGKASSANIPGARSSAATWVDASGNVWLFGGLEFDSTGAEEMLNDLWELDPTTLEWTWVSGSSTVGSAGGHSGIYGKEGTAASGDFPGGRYGSSSWIDAGGNLWLFGGYGFDSAGNNGYENDLWAFTPSSGLWTWVSGSSTVGCNSCTAVTSFGMMGTPAAGNTPGGRYGASSWIDSSGNFWLYGGDSGDTVGELEVDELWEYTPLTGYWTWIAGNGTDGVQPATSTDPGSLYGASSGTDLNGNFWLFGGGYLYQDPISEGSPQYIDNYSAELWELLPGSITPGNSGWITQGGSSNSVGCYYNDDGPYCAYRPSNYGDPGQPGGRVGAALWLDKYNNIWLFGGLGIDSKANSAILNDLWVFAKTAAEPVLSVPSGTYSAAQSVSIATTTSTASIYYTTDGTTPTAKSTLYSEPVTVNEGQETLKSVAIAPGYLPSTVASANYALTGLPPAAKPVISLSSGVYAGPQSVTIADSTPGAVIFYAFNQTPSANATPYTGSFTVSTSGVLEAIAVAPGYGPGPIATATYTIDATSTQLSVSTVTSPLFGLTCSLQAPATTGKPGPTGTFTFTDTTTGATLGTASVGSLTTRSSYPFMNNPAGDGVNGIVSGDFNHDGILDLAVTNGGDGTISILLGNGDGTFQPQVVYPVGSSPSSIAFGDFNNDGKIDLAVTNSGSSNVSILLGNGDGTFNAAAEVPVSIPMLGFPYFTKILVGDFNGDKKQDLAILGSDNKETATIAVLLGNGDGTFQTEKTAAAGTSVTGVVTGDFNDDGNLDIVVESQGTPSAPLALFAGKGDGTFQTPQTIAAGGQIPYAPTSLVAADFNGDGNMDLAVSGTIVSDSGTATGGITVLLGNGDGTFQYSSTLAQQVSGNFAPAFLSAGHFSSTSNLQLAVANSTNQTILIFTGAGNGTFSAPTSYPVPDGIGFIAANFGAGGGVDFAVAAANAVDVYYPADQDSATASLSNVAVNAGDIATHALQCSYSGDSHYSASTSAPVMETFSTAAVPEFSVLVGIYPASQTVTITDASPDATIYYTTDGSDPTIGSTQYTAPVTISATTKLKAIAAGIYLPSGITEAVYTITDSPAMTRIVGTKTTAQTITLTDLTPGAVIYYTTDGTVPTTRSAKYKAPFTLTKATLVRTFATSTGHINSRISEETYSIRLPEAPLTWAAPATITYGTALGKKELNAASTVKGTFTYSPAAGSVLSAGLHAITVTFTPANLHDYLTVKKTVEIDVTRATLTFAAVNESVAYDKAIPALRYTITGFVHSENASLLSGKPVETTTAKDGSKPGGYPITISAGKMKQAANYKFVFKSGRLTITPPAPAVKPTGKSSQ